MRLAETIAAWFGRVEVVLAGVDSLLREGEDALARGDAMSARRAARGALSRVPRSPLGLALLADACEAGGLDAELLQTLEELASLVPSRAEVWVRLARAKERVSCPKEEARDAMLQALSVAEPGSDSRREALLWLADADLASGDGARAGQWLDRLGAIRQRDVVVRKAEAFLASSGTEAATKALRELDTLDLDPTDGRAALARGRALTMLGDPAAIPSLLRALVLDTPGASESLSSALAWQPTDELLRARVRAVVHERGEADMARWKAAFARAEGRRDEARNALMTAVRSGEASAARALFSQALEDRDHASLSLALGVLESKMASENAKTLGRLISDARLIPPPARVRDRGEISAILEELSRITSPSLSAWSDEIRSAAIATWMPSSGEPSDWTQIFARLDHHARALHALDLSTSLASLAIERTRPIRVAIVGEFNAGKSTFINAMMGADVAPTGVLPTTATLHHLRYAPDSFARITLAPGDPSDTKERLVPSQELRATLRSLDPARVVRVELLHPISSLTRVEVLDTPGFNAPDPRHAEAAREAFEEADALLWLLDATQPFKKSELRVLEEAKALTLPVQLLVNKADRLKPSDLETVMGVIDKALVESGLRSWSSPIALSARLALAGRMGDPDALTRSGWIDVQHLLDEQIVGRSEELRERGLRRRVRTILGAMIEKTRAAASAADQRTQAFERRVALLSARAAELESDTESAAMELSKAIEPGHTAWKRDLEMLAIGRDAPSIAHDPALRRYAVDRALARLVVPLSVALAGLASIDADAGDSPRPESFTSFVRASVRTFASTSGPASDVLPLARSAVGSLIDWMLAQGSAPCPRGSAQTSLAELQAFLCVAADASEDAIPSGTALR
jgi:GTP-binding protein EngB required for normal cell division